MLLLQANAVSADTAISVGLVIVVLTAAIKLVAQLSDIKAELKRHEKVPEKVDNIEREMITVKGRLGDLEEDMNNLWAFARTDDAGTLFSVLRRGPRSRPGEGK
jgi:hypothetical protein